MRSLGKSFYLGDKNDIHLFVNDIFMTIKAQLRSLLPVNFLKIYFSKNNIHIK